jgi:hypothetical protein
MRSAIAELLDRIHQLEDELESELALRRQALAHKVKERTGRAEQEWRAAQRRLREGLFRYLRTTRLTTYLTAPVIYSLIVPLSLLDLSMTVYQRICFPAYGIPRARRGDYIALDRHDLPYLNLIERLNCVYCGYGNGVIAYAREVAARTEQYWCPIKHARKVLGAHRRYYGFLEHGDAEGYRNRLEAIREAVRAPQPPPGGDATGA